MPEAVIVDAIRTPIGRAVKGSLKSRSRRRPRRGPAARPCIERNPEVDFGADRRHHDGLRLRRGRAGLQRRPQRRPARGHRPPRPGHDRQPLLRLLAADRCAWPSTRSRPARATVHRRRRRGRLARRAAAHDLRVQPPARRLGGLALQRLHPDGPDRRERRRALQASAARRRTSGPSSRRTAPSTPRSPATSTRRSSPSTTPGAQGRPTRRATRSTSPRPTSTKDDGPRPGTTHGEARPQLQAGLQARTAP